MCCGVGLRWAERDEGVGEMGIARCYRCLDHCYQLLVRDPRALLMAVENASKHRQTLPHGSTPTPPRLHPLTVPPQHLHDFTLSKTTYRAGNHRKAPDLARRTPSDGARAGMEAENPAHKDVVGAKACSPRR